MGMFDYVEHEASCMSCEEPITTFQSKSGPNAMRKFTLRELYAYVACLDLLDGTQTEVEIHAICDCCSFMNRYKVGLCIRPENSR